MLARDQHFVRTVFTHCLHSVQTRHAEHVTSRCGSIWTSRAQHVVLACAHCAFIVRSFCYLGSMDTPITSRASTPCLACRAGGMLAPCHHSRIMHAMLAFKRYGVQLMCDCTPCWDSASTACLVSEYTPR